MRNPLRLKPRESLIELSLLAGYPLLSFVYAATAAFLLSACVHTPNPSDASFARCTPRFEDQNGWYGADAAFSVPLSEGPDRRTLWLFGDTFVEHDAATREWEDREFRKTVSDWDLARYFEII